MNRMLFSFVIIGLASLPAAADNWAHWRGPSGNGVATSAKPPINWSLSENIKWKVEIPGKGSGLTGHLGEPSVCCDRRVHRRTNRWR